MLHVHEVVHRHIFGFRKGTAWEHLVSLVSFSNPWESDIFIFSHVTTCMLICSSHWQWINVVKAVPMSTVVEHLPKNGSMMEQAYNWGGRGVNRILYTCTCHSHNYAELRWVHQLELCRMYIMCIVHTSRSIGVGLAHAHPN